MDDQYNLQRFVNAQDPVYGDALAILRRGVMCTPYMELIFPRLAAGLSDTDADPYAITSLDEAGAYLQSPILGGRYRECVGTLQRLSNLSARAVFGDEDTKKLHASLTLFSEASNDEFLLKTIFDVWFDGQIDEGTMRKLYSMS
ncbi:MULTISPECIES: DUF1810 family protein [unclassified Mesorhizobium]|uniref:DUF1810 domain-containing protein n=1 Tax=unclassified Mesorhizobium TaxID=325217 RepID=UPI0011293A56|nr:MULTISPECIES: DUF1810 family protein [unclassified Mesorhizobium]TPJ45971.1 DUF1810 family protein [Mesorhizobium sp. B2-6-6]MCA0008458.1 DUF1810 family protein [Mesorhizobium sp. B264B1B]MCA0021334.1 DUF1810 family protein [Mesorhizobium sp. B264B1A]MCA0026345.1 DUF1810 family protein [Mesorhizobium sp. B263B1A]MCA0056749.1 DUF1810 family protein [Mesorhizobium sp. B261B1A]